MDQRKSRRYQIQLPLRVLRRGTAPFFAQGQTCNLSSHGVLFTSDRAMAVGERIEFVIRWPCAGSRDEPMDLYCLGKVLRVTSGPDPGSFSIAATLDRHAFVRLRE